MRSFFFGAIACAGAAIPVLAQANISAADKFCWSENAGFLDWRDANGGSGGVRILDGAGFLRGFAWCENTGYLNLGNGAGPYANTNGTDFGVNLNLGTGNLTGYAWSENAGWVNFAGGSLAAPPNPARFDFGARRLRGYAWGENVGWINLDDPSVFIGVLCLADVDDGGSSGTPDGGVTIDDLLYYLAIFEAGSLSADVDDGSSTGTPDAGVTIDDLLYYLFRFEAGC